MPSLKAYAKFKSAQYFFLRIPLKVNIFTLILKGCNNIFDSTNRRIRKSKGYSIQTNGMQNQAKDT